MDILKIVAIIFVTLYHSQGAFILTPENPQVATTISTFIGCLLSIAVPTFFFINGALLLNKPFNAKKHLIKTAKTLILIYVWAVIIILCQLPIKNAQDFSFNKLIDYVLAFQGGWCNHLWFLVQLVLLYLFFPLIKTLYDNNKKLFLFFLGVILIFTYGASLAYGSAKVFVKIFGEDNFLSNFINRIYVHFAGNYDPGIRKYAWSLAIFMLGGIFFYWLQNNKERIMQKRLAVNIICAVTLVVALVCSYFYSKLMNIGDVVWSGYSSFFTGTMTVAFFTLFFVNISSKGNKCVRLLSSHVMGIYLIHYFIQNYVFAFYKTFIPFNEVPMKWLMTLTTLLISFVIVFLLQKIKYVKELFKL